VEIAALKAVGSNKVTCLVQMVLWKSLDLFHKLFWQHSAQDSSFQQASLSTVSIFKFLDYLLKIIDGLILVRKIKAGNGMFVERCF